MTLEEENRRGDEARRILQDPLLVEAFDQIKEELTQAWMQSPARDVEGREKTWLMLKLLNRVHGHLESVMANGQVAKATLLERARRLGRRTSK